MLYFRFLLALTVTISAVCSLLSCAGPAGAQTSRWRVPADFEQHPALLLGASQLLFHHPETLADIAGALEGRALVYGLLSSDAQASEMRRLLRAHDLPENAIRPVVVPVQSMWLRDYGPVFVQRDDGKVGVIDARYGGSEHNPDDDDVPTALAERWGAPVLDSELWLEGGQILSNGRGLLLVSTTLFTRNTAIEQIDVAEATDRLRIAIPFDQAMAIQPLEGEPTGHIDMFLAFLTADLLVVARIDHKLDPVNAALLDALAERMEGVATASGPLRVVRIDTPAATDGVWRSYTNCAMVGEVVLVPSYPEIADHFDDAALALYQQWLPERSAVLIEASTLAARRGALHCVSMPLPARAAPTTVREREPDGLPRPFFEGRSD